MWYNKKYHLSPKADTSHCTAATVLALDMPTELGADHRVARDLHRLRRFDSSFFGFECHH
jgi:hypothetical protein